MISSSYGPRETGSLPRCCSLSKCVRLRSEFVCIGTIWQVVSMQEMFCVSLAAPPSTVNITLNHNLDPEECSQISFPFCLLFWLPKKFVYQICFTVILSSPSRVMMPVHFSWPLVKSIWAVALVSPKLSLIETDGVHLKGPMEVCYFWCLQPTQILRHTGKHTIMQM